MRHVCAWCKAEIGTVESSTHPDSAITHGICDLCAERIASESKRSLGEFLDSVGFPVLLVDADVVVLGANKAARELLGKDADALEGQWGGDAIECFYANLPAGCGRDVHCKSCVIRNTIGETFETGKGFVRVKGFPDIQVGQEVKTMSVEISTEKVGGAVLLRIDELGDSTQ